MRSVPLIAMRACVAAHVADLVLRAVSAPTSLPRACVQTAVATATRQKPPMQEVKILQNISGVFKPGRICLLLGPPGGGKSMLMKACCGAAPVQVCDFSVRLQRSTPLACA